MSDSIKSILGCEQNILCPNEKAEQSISIRSLMEQDSMNNSQSEVYESKKQHIKKLQNLIKKQILKIKTNIRKLSMQFLKIKRLNGEKELRENVYNMIRLFQKASNKIIQAFFLLASNQDYLQFQSQSSIKEKLKFLKRQVNRGFIQTMKRVSKAKEDLQVDQFEYFEDKKKLRAKNCKIPATSTVVLEKWLTTNFYCPYPTEKERENMAKDSGMDYVQVNNWFINKRQKIIRKYIKKDFQLDFFQQSNGQCYFNPYNKNSIA